MTNPVVLQLEPHPTEGLEDESVIVSPPRKRRRRSLTTIPEPPRSITGKSQTGVARSWNGEPAPFDCRAADVRRQLSAMVTKLEDIKTAKSISRRFNGSSFRMPVSPLSNGVAVVAATAEELPRSRKVTFADPLCQAPLKASKKPALAGDQPVPEEPVLCSILRRTNHVSPVDRSLVIQGDVNAELLGALEAVTGGTRLSVWLTGWDHEQIALNRRWRARMHKFHSKQAVDLIDDMMC